MSLHHLAMKCLEIVNAGKLVDAGKPTGCGEPIFKEPRGLATVRYYYTWIPCLQTQNLMSARSYVRCPEVPAEFGPLTAPRSRHDLLLTALFIWDVQEICLSSAQAAFLFRLRQPAARRLHLMNSHIEKRVELRAPVSRVWRALTDYREFGEWFRVKLDGPFAPGQASRGRLTYPGYEHVKWEAVVQKMAPEHLFSFTWPHPKSLGQEDYSGEPTTLVEFRLEKTANGTLLLLTESGFDNIPGDRRQEAFRGNESGGTGQMKNIETYVAQSS
jgi:uncharacterized protein YndB with AHSA1/START domain